MRPDADKQRWLGDFAVDYWTTKPPGIGEPSDSEYGSDPRELRASAERLLRGGRYASAILLRRADNAARWEEIERWP